ncbi:tetratricopeptide repeat protein [Prochlorococcus marinus]|uniref:tetratricopeptide repeat protein n=1 Tax=Prochlorococcus marinus TaxID=1219 RepID=UPI0022B4CCCF|nr:tetratricopeptide repeat protein [Prochlorococcus marinus]
MYYKLDLAKTLFQKNKYQETIDACNDILDIEINSIEALKLIVKSLFALGKIEDARIHLHKLLNINPDDYEVIQDLANTYFAAGDNITAKDYYRKAISIKSDYAPALTYLGGIELNIGNKQVALSLLIKATESDPKLASAWLNLASAYFQLDNVKAAAVACRKSIELNPNLFNSHFLLANILINQNKLREAIEPLRKTIELKPNFFQANSALGALLGKFGKLKEAETLTRKAIEINPDSAIAHSNLANILKDIGKLQEAEVFALRATKIQPDLAEAHSNLANILRMLSKLKEAEISIHKAIEINPNIAESYYNLAGVLKDLGKIKEAESSIRKAIDLEPKSAIYHYNLGLIRIGLGEEVTYEFEKASKLDPKNLSFRIKSKLYISEIPFSQEQTDFERNQFKEQLAIIEKDKSLEFKGDLFSTCAFYLAYHNASDDLEILKLLGNVLRNSKGLINTKFNQEKGIIESQRRNSIRLGICSEYLKNHSVCMFFGNIIKQIASSDVEVIIFRTPYYKVDSLSQSIDSLASEVIMMPESIQEASDLILNQSIDILFYPDIGMSNYTYLLSLSRLALVQFTTLGHPMTSGLPEIDYFISCDNYETKYSNEFYSERLIKLNRIPVNYSKPINKGNTFNKSKLNISEKSFLIGIPHAPFKFHPDYDKILDKILENIPNSFLFFADGPKKLQTDKLKERWAKTTKLVLNRTIFYPRVSFGDFLEIVKMLDIIIDPFYFGMGNTFYQAMAFNTPVVTMPTNHMKSRHAFAGYKQMDIKGAPIANSPDEYISICKKLAFDKSYRENIETQINEKANKYLFNDETIFEEYIQFLKDSLSAAQNNTLLPENWKPKSNFS